MRTATLIEAKCGCRFQVVSALPVLTQGVLELATICVPHSEERTKALEKVEHDKEDTS